MQTSYKIPDKLWFIQKRNNQRPTNNENLGNENLSYMTYLEFNKKGEIDSSTKKRVETGVNWAMRYMEREGDYLSYGLTIDNEPIEGIYIGDTVSRWTTQNKLFRVIDPRGFTIEVATSNIALLLHYTTVVNGYIQSPCVYAYDSGQHFILPINSELYQEIKQEIYDYAVAKDNIIPPKQLQKGVLYQYLNGRYGYYLGCYNIRYQVAVYDDQYGHRYDQNTRKEYHMKYLRDELVEDKKVHLFVNYWVTSDRRFVKEWAGTTDILAPKVFRVATEYEVKHETDLLSVENLVNEQYKKYVPNRVEKKFSKPLPRYSFLKINAILSEV